VRGAVSANASAGTGGTVTLKSNNKVNVGGVELTPVSTGTTGTGSTTGATTGTGTTTIPANTSGLISADGTTAGGTVTVQAGTKLHTLPNSMIDAESTVSGPGGTVTLTAPVSKLEGTIDANGVDGGGNATVNGDTISSLGAIDANAVKTGNGGTIQLMGTTLNKILPTSLLHAMGGSTSGNGGTVTIATPNNISSASTDQVDVSSPTGTAGTFTH
jgi:hypothetical protein